MDTAQDSLTAVVVLGMHRSGTSILTRGLQVLGAELGEHLMAPTEFNPRGYWEDVEVVAINEKVLTALGSDWRSPMPTDAPAWDSEELKALSSIAAQLVQSRLQSFRTWGLKDPRLCRLLPFWQPVFREVGVQERYVISLRNPRAVCDSLRARDRILPELGYLLWIEHLSAALLGTEGKPRVLVDYDLALEHPGEELRRIAKALMLPEPAEGDPALMEYEREFLDPALRHHLYSEDDFSSDSHLARLALHAFRSLLAIARKETSSCDADLQAMAEKLRAEIGKLSDLFPLTAELSKGLQSSELELLWVREQVRQQQLELSQVSHGLAEMRAANQHLTATIEALNATNEWLASTNQALTAANESLTSAHQSLHAAHQSLTTTNESLNAANQALTERAESLTMTIESLAATNQSLTATAEALESQNSDLNSRLAIETEMNQSLHQTLAEETHRLWSSGSWRMFQPLRNVIRKMGGRAKETEPIPRTGEEAIQEIIAVRQSMSWELTSPLRIVRRLFSRPPQLDNRNVREKGEAQ